MNFLEVKVRILLQNFTEVKVKDSTDTAVLVPKNKVRVKEKVMPEILTLRKVIENIFLQKY